MDLLDFIIGALIVNAMPHFIFGITKTRYLGLFGYSPKGNVLYAVLQFLLALFLLLINYKWEEVINNGFLMGGISILVLFLTFGRFSLKLFNKKD